MEKLEPFDEDRFRKEFFPGGNPTEQFIEKTCRDVNFRISAGTIQTRDQILEFIIDSETGVMSEIGTGIDFQGLESIEPHRDRRQQLFEFLRATYATREEALRAAESIDTNPDFYEFLFCKKLARIRTARKNPNLRKLLPLNPLWKIEKDQGKMDNEFRMIISHFEADPSFQENDFESPAICALMKIAQRWGLPIEKDMANIFLQKIRSEIDHHLVYEADLPECFYSTLCDICEILGLSSIEIVEGFYEKLSHQLEIDKAMIAFNVIRIARGLEIQSKIPMPDNIKRVLDDIPFA